MTEEPSGGADVELAVARSTLEAARLLARAGFHRDAVTRSYYAIFHAASGLLATTGRRARTHEGLRSLISEHFVRPGLLDAEHARSLRRTAGDRNDADYDAASVFAEDDSREGLARAEAFVLAVEAILSSKR